MLFSLVEGFCIANLCRMFDTAKYFYVVVRLRHNFPFFSELYDVRSKHSILGKLSVIANSFSDCG